MIIDALSSNTPKYRESYPLLNEIPKWGLWKIYNLQKYNPGQGYHAVHCENDGCEIPKVASRILAWTIYLNTVTEGGGTHFPHYNKTIDAKEALKGVQLPIAGFRGSGLAWMVDIISGVLTGANHGGKVKDPFEDFTGPQNVGHLFLVLKPNLFVGKNYYKRIKENIKIIKKLPKVKGVKEILYPGEGMNARYKRNLKKGIFIQKNILEEIKKLNVVR